MQPHGDLAAIVLAAGFGRRLRPLTAERPKPLCPIAGVALVDLAVDRAAALGVEVAVNAHHAWRELVAHLDDGAGAARSHAVHVSVEHDRPLGTAGGVARLRPWIDGRAVVVVNSDAWCGADLAALLDDWDGRSIRILTHGEARFGPGSSIGGALLPWADVARLPVEPAGLYEVSWRAAAAEGRVDAIGFDGPFVDCGTPTDYLAANLLATRGTGFVDPSASVSPDAEVTASVVWDGAAVAAGERLVRAVRTRHGRTVLIR